MGFDMKLQSNGKPTDEMDFKELRKHIKKLKDIAKYSVKVGILKDKNDFKEQRVIGKGGKSTIKVNPAVSVAMVGAFMEYGTRTGIPRRSFLRDPIRGGMELINKTASVFIKKVMNNEVEPKKVLDMVGEQARNLSVKSFRENEWKANSQKTIKLKGSSKPLIDTGQLRQSIHYEVVKNA